MGTIQSANELFAGEDYEFVGNGDICGFVYTFLRIQSNEDGFEFIRKKNTNHHYPDGADRVFPLGQVAHFYEVEGRFRHIPKEQDKNIDLMASIRAICGG